MTTENIKKVTVLCETDDGQYIAGSTDDKLFIRHAAEVIQFVEIKPECVGNIDVEKIMVKKQENEQKLF